MDTTSSSAPPSAPPAPPAPPRHEFLLELEGAPKSRLRRRGPVDLIRLSPEGLELRHGGSLVEPLRLPLGAVAMACTETGGPRPAASEGRFAVLKRMSSTVVVPQTEGVEGWLWTSGGGSAFPSLCEDDEAPNAALIFTHPLGEDVLERTFTRQFVTALFARSPLGAPAVYGLLMRVADVARARDTFHKFNLERPLTDREVPPTLRRSLPTDRSPDPVVHMWDAHRAPGSVAPPGLS